MLLQRLQSLLRLTAGGGLDPEAAPEGVKRALADGCGVLDFDALSNKLKAANEAVLAAYERHIGAPATALPQAPAGETPK